MIRGGLFRDLRLNFIWSNIWFFFQRLTGLALVAYLFMHLWTLGAVLKGEQGFNASVGAYDTPIGHFIEWSLLICVAFHMFNGLRLIVVDWFSLTRRQLALIGWTTAIVIVVAVVSIPTFFMQ